MEVEHEFRLGLAVQCQTDMLIHLSLVTISKVTIDSGINICNDEAVSMLVVCPFFPQQFESGFGGRSRARECVMSVCIHLNS
jgi:hypothetical protein